MKLWEKGYKLNPRIEKFTVGNDYLLDQKLVKFDCLVSIAHTKMLGRIGILNKNEVKKLIRVLREIMKLEKKKKFFIKLTDEDCHTAIENYLIKKLGNLGKKIHTGRSRNDQVLGALRLFSKEELKEIQKLSKKLITIISKFIKKYRKVILPGYTHSRKAMPSTINLWGSSFIASMKDNLKLMDITLEIIDQSPLGSGAGYGIPLKIDKKYLATLLKFKRIQNNPLYCQNSRGKFESTILHLLTQIMFDLNKISSDIIIFSMPEFGYFELPSELSTGSSLMPQKKNPDALELIRAKYHVVVSYEFQIKNIISNLLSGYHRDFQLTKEPLMKSFEITKESLAIMGLIFQKLKVNKENCQKALTSEIYLTEKVYKLVQKGIPFRIGYRKIAKNEKI